MSEVKGTKALELWCKRLIKDCPEVQIENMTTSWRNGMAFCALVHHFRPDLIDVSKLNPENIYENNQLAYSVAEKHLGIPALLDPEDMVENDVPDRLSILTYLSQFYQRLGHTVNTKVSESEPKVAPSSQGTTPIKFGKVALDKCAACGLPVYLAQRLMVSQKLYHRRCFRCSKCSGHLNPKNYHIIDSTNFCCDSCKNEKTIPKFLNNNDQIGMLAFSSDMSSSPAPQNDEPVSTNVRPRPQSILEKINMFENKNIEKDLNIEDRVANISIKENIDNNKSKFSNIEKPDKTEDQDIETNSIKNSLKDKDVNYINYETVYNNIPEKVYKTNKDKFSFLQTQLSDDTLEIDSTLNSTMESNDLDKDCTNEIVEKIDIMNNLEEESNITDDSRIAQGNGIVTNLDSSTIEMTEDKTEQQVTICIPPRRKKHHLMEKKAEVEHKVEILNTTKEYPDHLNPFSDDEDEGSVKTENKGENGILVGSIHCPVKACQNHFSEEFGKHEPEHEHRKVSTNPFGSSEDEDEVPPMPPPKVPDIQTSTPLKRHIKAYNPFWSDGEEPSSDEETDDKSMHKSSLTTSSPDLPASTPRRRKLKAPPPPRIAEHLDVPSTSTDDVASISSFSSHTSTVHSDQKSFGVSTPKLKKKRPAPTPPDSLSTLSGCGGSIERGVDSLEIRNTSDGGRRVKGPAPGLPLPERREVKLQISAEELQVQLDLLETQQLGLERQGVMIERMIRDKCEGEEGPTAPQEEIEDLVIQLCELVNEKNDLFRKQTELMYIRRQQRLEQEQADIEHEIRIIQSRPAVNRIDADKAREEQLVSRLVELVRLRDELVQQLDAERRRERQEDLAIAASIANKRAQRNSESNSSSIKSADAITPVKKSKVKDKVKKQLKKAKHSLISKKKDEDKTDKEKKPK